jgi:hypothetical protein
MLDFLSALGSGLMPDWVRDLAKGLPRGPNSRAMTTNTIPDDTVRHFRQIVLWPLQIPSADDIAQNHFAVLRRTQGHPWRYIERKWSGTDTLFSEEHYAEFITFLPYVQRFLYGEAEHRRHGHYGESPLRVFARDDITRARVQLQPDSPTLELTVERAQLYFFLDIDVVLLAVEISAHDLTFAVTQDLVFRFGRAYPAFWHTNGQGGRCPVSVEWIGKDGNVLARSDYENKARYLASVAKSHTPCIASHWEWLLRPMVPDYAEERGLLRYRELEYYRMPLLGYLAFEEPTSLSRADFVNLGLVTGSADRERLPGSSGSLDDFEQKYAYDRYWAPSEKHAFTNTRLLCTGHTFLMVGKFSDPFFTDAETGLLAQFRRQYFLLGLIAHFHKAALLMFSDRQEWAIGHLDVTKVESVKRFKRQIRHAMRTFLRFTHRYWFHEVSTVDQATKLFRMWSGHLDTDRLYMEVREEIQDMSDYLDSDSLRRQANTVVRLTVVTTLGLIGTIATGVLGMNIFASADNPWTTKLLYFMIVLIPTLALTLFTVYKSKALADFLEALSERSLARSRRRDVLEGIEPI